MTGWNLPPGCTDLDIEIAQGAVIACECCGRYFEPREEGQTTCGQVVCSDPDMAMEDRRNDRAEGFF